MEWLTQARYASYNWMPPQDYFMYLLHQAVDDYRVHECLNLPNYSMAEITRLDLQFYGCLDSRLP